ncbi:MAG: C40 family peptidase [Longispora sp.]|nr:C40 family peptidase [Longispora sp. (in: high G+C Gram-positive bacteria)]
MLRGALTVVGACVLAASVPTIAHADPDTEVQTRIDHNAGELSQVSREHDKVRQTLSRAKATLEVIEEKLVPLDAKSLATNVVRRDPDHVPSGISGIAGTFPTRACHDTSETLEAAQDELSTEKVRLKTLIAEHDRHQSTLTERKREIETTGTKLVNERDNARASRASSRSAGGSSTGGSSAGGSGGEFTPPADASRAQIAIAYARAQLGKSYVYGAAGPNSFDCSGLTMRAWGAAGVNIGGHQTHSQWGATSRVDRSQLQPGDLVFFYGRGHVGLYIGGNQVIHAPTSGDVVKITSLDSFGGYDGAGRP